MRICSIALLAAASLLTGAQALAAVDYSVEFVGAPQGLRRELQLASTLAAGNRIAPTRAMLGVLAQRDIAPLVEALRAAGYYAASVSYDIAADAPVVTFHATPGPLFRVTYYVIRYEDEAEGRPSTFEEAGVRTTGAADGAALEALQTQFLGSLWNSGYPAARSIGRRAEADFEAGTARAVFLFASGPRARFGEVRVTGASAVRPDHIARIAPFEAGALYDRKEIIEYRDRLDATNLFSSVDVEPGAPEADGRAPILVSVAERKPRTFGVGASYSTSEGPGGRLYFEYRNLFGRGERARVEAEASGVEQSLSLDLNKPLPGFPGEAFGQLAFENETTDAFDARTVRLGAGLLRLWFDERLETRAALAFESSKVRSDVSEERTYLVSLPLSATWNTEDDLLDPTTGFRAGLLVTPYTGTSVFTTAELNARTRINFGADDRFTTAFRARLGSAFGSSLAGIPLNRRLYAGGGASIRGYGFQEAGPLDVDGVPTGGRSVVEGAIEMRARVAEKFQIAAFIDAGTVGPDPLPSFDEDLFVGAGGGLRYDTPIGPIRLDIATPLRKRSTDRGFQVYVSLGQPF